MIEQEYGIKTKPASSGNPQANAIIDRIHQVLGNLIRSFTLHNTYVDDADPWMGILVASAFAVRSTYHQTKEKNPGELVFFQDMILPINHLENWRLILQRKQVQIDKYVIRENSTTVDHGYIIGYWVMVKGKRL